MFHFRQKNSGEIYGVLVDIASGSVGVGITKSNTEATLPEVLYVHRADMRVTNQAASREVALRKIRESLFECALLLSQNGLSIVNQQDPHARISKIFVTCSSPWSYTIARNVHYENDEAFKITKPIITDLIQSAEDEILTHLREDAHASGESFTVVERATVDIAINEYPVTHPLSLTGKVLDLSHIVGAIPEEILGYVHEMQDKLFPDTDLRVHTSMLTIYCVLRDILPTLHSLCILNLTGESTECGIVEHNLLTENTSMDWGIHTFIRSLAQIADRPITEIQTLLADPVAARTDSVLLEHTSEYVNKLGEMLTELLTHRVIPRDAVIIIPTRYEAFYKDLVIQALNKALGESVRSISIEPKYINDLYKDNEHDIHLGLSARFFHKLHGCGEMDVF